VALIRLRNDRSRAVVAARHIAANILPEGEQDRFH
jgi:hypothetical protein